MPLLAARRSSEALMRVQRILRLIRPRLRLRFPESLKSAQFGEKSGISAGAGTAIFTTA
jgi:hypothetical protein